MFAVMRRGVLGMLVVGAAVSAGAPAPAQGATYSGRFACDDRGSEVGMPGARVEIWGQGPIGLWPELAGEVLARGFTDEEGGFSLAGPARDGRVFARVLYHDAFDVSLNDWASPGDRTNDSDRIEARNGDVDFRQITLRADDGATGSPRCAVFRGVHKARLAWQQEIGTDVPNHAREIGWNYPNAGTFDPGRGRPFTAGTGIKWPDTAPVGMGNGDFSTALHEFGHSIRHGFDGDIFHFLDDAFLRFSYLQFHEPCSRYNEGFGFNEGWANYWAGEWAEVTCYAADDYAVEGRVARALKLLELRCAGGDRRLMVDVLRRNPGRIHSFAEFRDALGCPVAPLETPIPEGVPAEAPPPARPTIPGSTTLTNLRRAIGALGPRIGSGALPVRLSCARASACVRRARRPLERIVLAGQRDVLRRQRVEYEAIATQAGRARLRKLGPRAVFRGLEQRERAVAQAIERIQRRTVRRVLRLTSGRPGLVAIAQGARRLLRALDRRGPTPVPMSLPSFDRPRIGPLQAVVAPPAPVGGTATPPGPGQPAGEQPPPQPPSPPQEQPKPQEPAKTGSSIALSCPAAGKPKGTVAWSGELTPAQAADISVQLTRPDGTSATSTVAADASGTFSGSFDTTSPGTWELVVSWAGDAGHTGSSASCEVLVG